MKLIFKIVFSIVCLCITNNAIGQIFTQGFEGATFPPTTPANWIVLDNGVGTVQSWTTTSAITTPPTVNSGTKAAVIEREILSVGTITEDWLVSHRFTVPANGQLRFYTRLGFTGNNGTTFEIKASTDPVQSNRAGFTNTLASYTEPNLVTTYNVYEEKIIDFPASLIGQQVYIAFVRVFNRTSSAVQGDRWVIDDVIVQEKCLDPTIINVGEITPTTASLNWINNGDATQWDIYIGISNNNTAPSFLPSNTVPTYPNVSVNPFVATGLNSGTGYHYFVRSVCTNGRKGVWVGPFNFLTRPAGSTCTAPINITTLPYNQSSNTYSYGDEFDTPQGTSCAGDATNYMAGDEVFYSFTPTFTGNISITMTPTESNSSLFVYNGCANVGVNCLASVADATSSPRVIPSLAVTAGQTYLIVISSSTTPISGIPYNLLVQQQTSCVSPSDNNLVISNNSANISWTNVGNASYQIELVQNTLANQNYIPVNPITVTTNNYQANNLNSDSYTLWIRTICSSNTYSSWYRINFVTYCTPTKISSDYGYNGTSAHLIIEPQSINSPSALQREICIKPYVVGDTVTATDIITSIGQSNDYLVTGLESDIIYSAFVRSNCGVNGLSEWSKPYRIGGFADLGDCVKRSNSVVSRKILFKNLINHILGIMNSVNTSTIIQGYNPPEMQALAPYVSDSNPKIYNFSFVNGTLSFSFSSHTGAARKDVTISGLQSNNSTTLTDLDVNSYYSTEYFMHEIPATFSNGIGLITLKHVRFCDLNCPIALDGIISSHGPSDNSGGEGYIEYTCGERLTYFNFDYDTQLYPILNYEWTFLSPTGTILAVSNASNPTFTFTTTGNNTVQLVVTQPDGCKTTFTQVISVVDCNTNCEVNFNFNFKLPLLERGGLLTTPERENIANGLVNFVNNNITQNLYLTTYDDFSTGVRTGSNQIRYTTLFPPATTNASGETLGGFFRFQDDPYNDTFKNIITNPINGILVNTELTKKIDVSFFLISQERYADMNQVIAAYNQLLNSNKTKKIFFVLLNEGVFTNYTTNTSITPLQFITQVKGSTPIDYSSTSNFLTSDYVIFSKAQIANSSFPNLFAEFMQGAFNKVKLKNCIPPSCTVTNPKSAAVKQKFIKLVNHLNSLTTAIPNGYTCPELYALKPYLTDANPAIYNFTRTATQFSFSFSAADGNVKDVVLSYNASNSLVSFTLPLYNSPTTITDLETVLTSTTQQGTNTVRHINFCPQDLCVNHIAFVIDESGSLSIPEKRKIKRQLKGFFEQQLAFNTSPAGSTLSNMYVSLIGMSDQDQDKRTDHVLFEKINVTTLPKFLKWIDGDTSGAKGYGDRYANASYPGVSEGADFWKSGLDLALRTSPDMVIMITDGSQTALPFNNNDNLKTTMAGFNNYGHNDAKPPVLSNNKPHLFVIGIDDGFYVYENQTTNKQISRAEDPNFNPSLKSSSAESRVTSALKLSLKYLLNLSNPIFPYSTSLVEFAKEDYVGYSNFDYIGDPVNKNFLSTNIARAFKDAGLDCGPKVALNRCDTCFSFQPEPGKFYVLNAWTKEELNVQVQNYDNPKIKIIFKDLLNDPIPGPNGEITASTTGDIIEGWQRIWKKFEIPAQTAFIEFELVNDSNDVPVFFDDIRIYPIKGSVKSFVYDPETFRLMSELDENNYATYYEYDNEGGLVRVKKETAKGIKTIQETRSGNVIKN